MIPRLTTTAMVGLLVLGAAACGTRTEAVEPPGDLPAAACPVGDLDCFETGAEPGTGEQPGLGMCAPDVSDCVDVIVDDASGDRCLPTAVDCDDTPLGGEFPTEEARQSAAALLGVSEADVPDDARVARRGAESMALTEDDVLGRLTVELDDTDGSGFRVVTATVELPDGPETVELTPG